MDHLKLKKRILIRKRDILPYMQQGLTATQIGKIFGMKGDKIRRYALELRTAGYDVPKRKGGRPTIPN